MKYRKQRILFAVGIGVICLGLFFSQPTRTYAASLSPGEIIAAINAVRVNRHLPALAVNQKLMVAAQNKLADMISKHYFAHRSPNGQMPWDFMLAAGYEYSYAGENLAIDYTNVTDVIRAWLASPAHRQNIMDNNFQETGVAVTQANNHYYSIQLFGATNNSVVSVNVPTIIAPPPAPDNDQLADKPTAPVIPITTSIPDNTGHENQPTFNGLFRQFAEMPNSDGYQTILGIATTPPLGRETGNHPSINLVLLFGIIIYCATMIKLITQPLS